jgi:hypothetical protein
MTRLNGGQQLGLVPRNPAVGLPPRATDTPRTISKRLDPFPFSLSLYIREANRSSKFIIHVMFMCHRVNLNATT